MYIFRLKTSTSIFAFSFILLMLLGYQMHAQDIQILLPNQYNGKVKPNSRQYTESFYIYEAAVSPVINLKQFKRYKREYNLPDSVSIILPEMTNTIDTSLLIGFIRAKETSTGHLVLLIATNYTTKEVTFYIDSNLDGNYKNDNPAITILAGTPPINIELSPPNEIPFDLSLGVPKRLSKEEQQVALIKDLNRKEKNNISNSLAFELHGGVGSSKLTYQFDDLNRGFPVWYNVSQSEKNIGVALSYDFPLLRVGLSATFQHLFQYTSYLNTRFAEQEIITDPRTNRTTIRENVQVDRNIDDHARSRVQWSTFITGRIRLREYLELQPLINIGQVSTFPNEYLADTRINIRAYDLPANPFLELGIRFEGLTGDRRALFFGISRSKLWWKPANFLEEGQANYWSKAITWKILGGYRFARKR